MEKELKEPKTQCCSCRVHISVQAKALQPCSVSQAQRFPARLRARPACVMTKGFSLDCRQQAAAAPTWERTLWGAQLPRTSGHAVSCAVPNIPLSTLLPMCSRVASCHSCRATCVNQPEV